MCGVMQFGDPLGYVRQWRQIRDDADPMGFYCGLERFNEEWPSVSMPVDFWQLTDSEREAYAHYVEQRAIALARLAEAHGMAFEFIPPAQCLKILSSGSAPVENRPIPGYVVKEGQREGIKDARRGKIATSAKNETETLKAVSTVLRELKLTPKKTNDFAKSIQEQVKATIGRHVGIGAILKALGEIQKKS